MASANDPQPADEGPTSSQGPKVTFACFVDGQLNLFSARTTDLDYVAVSHVFGKTEWLTIPGVEGEVLASRHKARFIEKDLPSLLDGMAFWMDILTVDQKDQAQVIAAVQTIPRIFSDAARTLAVREDDGIYECCAEALEGVQGLDDFYEKMWHHNTKHYGDVIHESYLQRLWTLQECMLSHTIQFTVCTKGK